MTDINKNKSPRPAFSRAGLVLSRPLRGGGVSTFLRECSICGIVKDKSEFKKSSRQNLNRCKSCLKERAIRLQQSGEAKECKMCGIIKTTCDFAIDSSGCLDTKCKDCRIIYYRDYAEKNRDRLRELELARRKPRKVIPQVCKKCNCNLNDNNRIIVNHKGRKSPVKRFICKSCYNKYANSLYKKYSQRSDFREKAAVRAKNYYHENRNVVRERQRRERILNPIKHKEWKQNAYKRNKDKILSHQREYYKKNKELFYRRSTRYKEKSRAEVNDTYIKDLFRQSGLPITPPELIKLKRIQIIGKRILKIKENESRRVTQPTEPNAQRLTERSS